MNRFKLTSWYCGLWVNTNTAILSPEGWNIFFPQEEVKGRTKLLLKQKIARSKMPTLQTWDVYQALLINITWREDRDSYLLLIFSIYLSVGASCFHLLWKTKKRWKLLYKNYVNSYNTSQGKGLLLLLHTPDWAVSALEPLFPLWKGTFLLCHREFAQLRGKTSSNSQ